MVEVSCVGGPHDGRQVDVVPGIGEVPPLLITVDGVRYVRAPDYGKAARDGWQYVPLNG